jgi:multidrug efflux system outer membrane protein
MLALGATQPGCLVGPDYRAPDVARPPGFKGDVANAQPTTRPIPTAWWRLYDDPQLDRLVAAADAANQDIRQALGRVDQARAQARAAASFTLPTITLDPSYTRTRTSGNRASPVTGQRTPAFTFNDWRIPFDLTYEVDVWGRLRRAVQVAEAQVRASEADEAVVRLTIRSDVALFYYSLRSFDAQAQILQQTVAAFEEQVRLVRAQFKTGLADPIALYQAQAQLDATAAQLRDVRRARDDEEHAIAILCGEAPASFSIEPKPLVDASTPPVPAGLPAELLRRRPDVAEAEQNVVAANAQVGVATAEFFPKFTLTGTAGFESASAGDLLDWRSKMASIAPAVSVPIFEGGRLRANLEATQAQYRQTVAAYVNLVLAAYGEVEDALTDLHATSDEARRLRSAIDASSEYVRVARVQFDRGLATYLVVIDAERTLLSNQLSLAQAVSAQTAASLRLVKALGGGWEGLPDRH